MSKSEEYRKAVQRGENVVAFRECGKCKQALRIVQVNDERQVAIDRSTGDRHVCWNLPEDANLVVID